MRRVLNLRPGAGEGLQRVHGPGVGPKAGGEHIEGSVPVLAEVDVDETFVGIGLVEEPAGRQVPEAVTTKRPSGIRADRFPPEARTRPRSK